MQATGTPASYFFEGYQLLPEKRELRDAGGQPVVLRGKVFDLLWYLLQHRGRLVSKPELLEALWPDTVVEENNLNQAVSALRQALNDDPKSPAFIATVKGRGYQFVAAVSTESADRATPKPGPSLATRNRLLFLAIAGVAAFAILWMNSDREPQPVPGSAIIERFAEASPTLATDFPGSHSEPSLSPDGRMMAFVSNVSGTSQIWVKNLQRGDPLQITNGPYAAVSPSWSPRDDQILFIHHGPDVSSIMSVGTLGGPTAATVVEDASGPNWSKRADAFVFARRSEVWIARNDGRDVEKINGVPVSQGFAAREPALSPDGKLVAFIHADAGPLGNLWVIPATGGEARQLTDLETDGGIAGAPEWSSDGNYIVFSVEKGTSASQLWRVHVESGEAAPLTSGVGGASDPALSIDGRRLVYTVTRTEWRLTRIDAETEEVSTIHASRQPVILPVGSGDGSKIAFFSRSAQGMHLYMIGSDGSNLRQLTFDEGGANMLPTWGSDNESILYYRGRSLHRLNPLDGSDTQVFADFDWSSNIWVAEYGDRLTYHVVDRPGRTRRTLIREIGESEEIELPVPMEAAKWSPDGRSLAGWHRATGEIVVCDVDTVDCASVERDAEKIIGVYPAWSRDGAQLFFLRAEDRRCCDVWRTDLDGRNQQRIAILEGFDHENGFYGIDANGDIFYNHLDRSTSEIWIADLATTGSAIESGSGH